MKSVPLNCFDIQYIQLEQVKAAQNMQMLLIIFTLKLSEFED